LTEKYKLNDLVRLRKCDIKKDKAKKDKLIKIVKFAFQEVVGFKESRELLLSGKKTMADIIKMETFRSQLMFFIERYLSMNGLTSIVALMGQDPSVEVKLSRGSLTVFEIGEPKQT